MKIMKEKLNVYIITWGVGREEFYVVAKSFKDAILKFEYEHHDFEDTIINIERKIRDIYL